MAPTRDRPSTQVDEPPGQAKPSWAQAAPGTSTGSAINVPMDTRSPGHETWSKSKHTAGLWGRAFSGIAPAVWMESPPQSKGAWCDPPRPALASAGGSSGRGVGRTLTPFMVTAVCTLEATASTRDAMRSQFTPSFFLRMAFSAYTRAHSTLFCCRAWSQETPAGGRRLRGRQDPPPWGACRVPRTARAGLPARSVRELHKHAEAQAPHPGKHGYLSQPLPTHGGLTLSPTHSSVGSLTPRELQRHSKTRTQTCSPPSGLLSAPGAATGDRSPTPTPAPHSCHSPRDCSQILPFPGPPRRGPAGHGALGASAVPGSDAEAPAPQGRELRVMGWRVAAGAHVPRNVTKQVQNTGNE